MDYSNLVPIKLLKQAGLSAEDIDLAIQLSYNVSEAVNLRRTASRNDVVSPSEQGQPQEERYRREKAEDDRIFLGAVILLAQRMKLKR